MSPQDFFKAAQLRAGHAVLTPDEEKKINWSVFDGVNMEKFTVARSEALFNVARQVDKIRHHRH